MRADQPAPDATHRGGGVARRDLSLVGDVGEHAGQKLERVHRLAAGRPASAAITSTRRTGAAGASCSARRQHILVRCLLEKGFDFSSAFDDSALVAVSGASALKQLGL